MANKHKTTQQKLNKKRCVFFEKDTIELEEQLAVASQAGNVLNSVHNGTFYFGKSKKDEQYHFFLLTPEKGNNSESWIYYDMQKLGAEPVTVSGTTFFSPSYILRLNTELLREKSALIEYFYQYRNYRILRRMKRNTVSSAFFVFALTLLCFFSQGWELAFNLFFLACSCAFLLHFVLSLMHFSKSCKKKYGIVPFKKPRRPGY